MTDDKKLLAISEVYHKAADETNDSADHDELHAAAAVIVALSGGTMTDKEHEYINRWILGLKGKHGLQN